MRLRRFIAGDALITLLLATVYAPLFHVHTEAGHAPLVHAHLPELEPSEDESVVHMEPPHSHARARSIDLLITASAHSVQLCAIVEQPQLYPNSIQPSCGFVAIATTRSHDPPAVSSLIPRAPPA